MTPPPTFARSDSAFRNPEAEAQAARVDDRREHGARPDELAGVDGPGVDDPGDLGTHLGPPQVLPRDPEGGLRHVHGRAEARVLALRARQLLHRQEVVLGQGLAALQVGPGAVLLRPGLLEQGLRPLGLQPVPVGVDPQEHRPGTDPVALAEAHVGRDAVHLGRDLDHVARFDLAERLDLVDDVLDGDGGDANAEGRALLPGGGGVAAAAAGGPRALPPRGQGREGACGSRGSSLMKPGPVRGEEARAGRDR